MGEIKRVSNIVGVAECLLDLGWKRTGEYLAEGVARPALTVDSAKAGADDGVGVHLKGNTQARCKILVVLGHIHGLVDTADAANEDVAIIQVKQAAGARRVHRFGGIKLPPETIVEGEFRGHAPLVLGIKKEARLPGLRVHVCGLGAPEERGVAQQESGPAQAGRGGNSAAAVYRA